MTQPVNLDATVERLRGPGLPSNMALGTKVVSWHDISTVLCALSEAEQAATTEASLRREYHARAEAAEEALARAMFKERWPGKSWDGRDANRAYWRRLARDFIARTTLASMKGEG